MQRYTKVLTNLFFVSADNRPIISFAFYVSLLVILFLQLTFGVLSAALAIINATKNPTEPVFGLPGEFISYTCRVLLQNFSGERVC